MFRRALVQKLLPLALLVFGAVPVLAQQVQPTRIWSVPLGSKLTELGPDFVAPACGTDGGPPGRTLADFSDFSQCPAEASGLREIWFQYDDTMEYMARAVRNPVAIAQNQAMAITGQPVILSFLVGDDGRIRGYRIFTDPRADERTRFEAHVLSATFRGLLGTGWSCEDSAPSNGETAIQKIYINKHCTVATDKVTGVLAAKLYFKAGQDVVDGATGKPMVNQFESSAQLEVLQAPFEDAEGLAAPADPVGTPTTPVELFLAGQSKDCPGCDLRGADLRRRDLSGVNLRGADLTKAVLHRAILRGTDLSGATLQRVNLNLADLSQANFQNADITNAQLFHVEGGRADFSGAVLSNSRMGDANLRQANFDRAVLDKVDLGGAFLNNARFAGTSLAGSYLYQASLLRADMTGTRAADANFVSAKMRGADLSRAVFTNSDFQAADLGGANLTDADFRRVRLEFANMRDAIRTGAIFTGALMPDGSTAP